MDKIEFYSTNRTAMIIDVSANTLKRWYKWYNDDRFEKPLGLYLPEPKKMDNRGTMFFTMEDVQKLCVFKEQLKGEYRGVMADFNAYWQWGQRGTQILENKRKKDNNEQSRNEQQLVNVD